MTEQEAIEQLKELHTKKQKPFYGTRFLCAGCGQFWPCDTSKILKKVGK